jgi:tetratricopeptide (TPR) repeat protein
MERLGEDADNFRSAMLRSLGSGHVQTALRLVVALWREAEIRGSWREGRERPEHWREGRARLELVLGAPETEAYPELREKALAGLGMLAYRMGDMETAKRRFGESLSTARNLNDKAGMANALNDLGNVAQLEGDLEAACQYYNESLSLERKMGNARAVAVSLFNLGNSARRLGKLGDARALLEESLQSFERDGQVREAAFPLNALARTAIAQNQWNAATAYASRSLAIRRALSDKRGIGESLRTMGMAEFGQGLIDRALPHFSEALELARSVGNKREIANTLEQVARVAIHQRATATAVALYAAAGRIRDEGDVRLAPAERIEPAEHLAAARAALGDSEFDVHQQAGRAMNAEDWCQAISSLESAPFGARLPSA